MKAAAVSLLAAMRSRRSHWALGERYEFRAPHDVDGIGKFYLGREIAQVMGPGGILWLERPERETKRSPSW